MTPPDLMDAADRVWDAAYALDELLGDRRVSEWTAGKIRDLMRAGRADDVGEIEKLADALEKRLGLEQGQSNAASDLRHEQA